MLSASPRKSWTRGGCGIRIVVLCFYHLADWPADLGRVELVALLQ
jgi:hypothetical protein